ncbi:MAG: c-type cytochrome [Propionibacteriaceae bacterium]|nr:c-type cytochrome [Propionibacteriaceae bacterium]
MRFLSSRKRHKAAKPLVVALALVLMGAFYATLTPSVSSAESAKTQQIAEGKALYDVTCSSCHGLNGEGSSIGPTLIGVGSASVDFQMGTGRMPAARPEAQLPKRTVIYSQAQIEAVGAYIDTFGAGPKIPDPSQYSPEGLTAEQIARGGELFRTNCSACHAIVGGGGALPNGKYAPSLKQTKEVHIWEALRTGPQQMPSFPQTVITDDDARAIIGYLKKASDQPNYGGLGLGGLGPVSEGFWAWLVGIGGLVLVALWLAKKGARAR